MRNVVATDDVRTANADEGRLSNEAPDSESEDSSASQGLVKQAEFRTAIDELTRQWQEKLLENQDNLVRKQQETFQDHIKQQQEALQKRDGEMLQLFRDFGDRIDKGFDHSKSDVAANMDSLHRLLDGKL